MKILIIGGSQFIGPLILDKLVKKNHDIIVFNRGKTKSQYDNVKFIKGDRRNGFNIKDYFDVVIDTCAYKGEYTKKAIDELNFDFYVHVSTAACYKKTTKFPLTEESELGDWPLWNLIWLDYNKGKVDCEKVLQKSDIKYAIIRPVYILGKGNNVDRENFIYSSIKNQKPLIIPGNGEAKVQFVFAEDVADSIVLLTEKKLEGAFNCCNDNIIALKGAVPGRKGTLLEIRASI